MHELVKRVLQFVRDRQLISAGDRVGVAVSGGPDSVALLRFLLALRAEFGIVLSVAHFNHKIRSREADEDAEFVACLASQFGLPFHLGSEDIPARTAESTAGLEGTAREHRYAFFRDLIHTGTVNVIATGHTQDDQAETVMMRMIRGTATRGMAGIYPRVTVESDRSVAGSIVRPILQVRRSEIMAYLSEQAQVSREDITNKDEHYLRNRVRRRLMPLLERDFSPLIVQHLSDLAEISRGEQESCNAELLCILKSGVWRTEPPVSVGDLAVRGNFDSSRTHYLYIDRFRQLPLNKQRHCVRFVLERVGIYPAFRQIEEVRELALSPAASGLSLPRGLVVRRSRKELCFSPAIPVSDYEYELLVPGEVVVAEAGIRVLACTVENGGYNPEHLYDAALFSGGLKVRNWRPGDRYFPAHTRAEKKVKELLTDAHVAGDLRRSWPVITCVDKIIWVRGFPAPRRFTPTEHTERVVVLREEPLRTAGNVRDDQEL